MNNIQKYRGLKNISQKDLAIQLDLTRPGLSYIENGKAKFISKKTLTKLSEILEVSPVKLLGIENLKYIPRDKEDVDFMIEILENLKEKM